MKFDVTKITGFETMTADEKVEALLNFEIETPEGNTADEVAKLKNALSKANSEAAANKREAREFAEKWKAGLDEAKRAEVERAERDKAVEEELRGLRRDKAVSGYVANCLALGYDKDLALRAAEAMADNDAATILACQQDFLEAKQKELEAAALNKQPSLTSGAPPTATQADKDAINKERRYFGLPPIK